VAIAADVTVRVRFAPSPTGYFHVGGAKTALYNWLYARQHGGVFVLRIEDTDAERNSDEWTQGILDALTWIGVDWDEGPYFQSTLVERHRAVAMDLATRGLAYYCGCSREQIDARAALTKRPGYDGHCRELGVGPAEGRALRFRTPDVGSTTVHDLIRGEPTFENALIEDFVILRGNGSPMFLLANVVDDIDMAITHVIRGEEHLANTPKALLLWNAITDAPAPTFAHVPILVNEARQKLSKRRDKVALEQYRAEGYLPEAMRNFLMLLGWAPSGDREVVDFDTVILPEFRLADVNSSPAFFDVRKLNAVNGDYIRALSTDEFVSRCEPWLTSGNVPWDAMRYRPEWFAVMAPLVQERVTRLDEVPGYVDFLFLDEPVMDEVSWTKTMKDSAAEMLDGFASAMPGIEWRAEAIKDALAGVGEGLGLKLGKAQAPIRVAVTGRTVGPPLFEPMELIGRDEVARRVHAARNRL
jgi:glutamyl-tRNA synthetase